MIEKMFNLAQYAVPTDDFTPESAPSDGPLPVRNPGKMEFVRVMPDPAYHACVCILADTRSDTIYVVDPELRADLEGDVGTAEITVATNQDGEFFVWLAKLPPYENEPFGVTRMAALNQAKTTWTRLRVRADRKGYDAIPAAKSFPEPEWPAASFDELFQASFADRIIDSLDHPVVKRLRGESA